MQCIKNFEGGGGSKGVLGVGSQVFGKGGGVRGGGGLFSVFQLKVERGPSEEEARGGGGGQSARTMSVERGGGGGGNFFSGSKFPRSFEKRALSVGPNVMQSDLG